jgi:glyoxylase I family protein
MMDARVDHVVIWVEDPLRSVDFYRDVIGLSPVRADEFRDGKAPFPSVRVSDISIIDLVARSAAPSVDTLHGVPGSAGNLVNHVCLSVSETDFKALRDRLAENQVGLLATMENTFGASGFAREAFYFPDPDGNVIEVRYYS